MSTRNSIYYSIRHVSNGKRIISTAIWLELNCYLRIGYYWAPTVTDMNILDDIYCPYSLAAPVQKINTGLLQSALLRSKFWRAAHTLNKATAGSFWQKCQPLASECEYNPRSDREEPYTPKNKTLFYAVSPTKRCSNTDTLYGRLNPDIDTYCEK